MRILFKTLSIVLVVLFVIMIPLNVVLRMFDNTLALLVSGSKFWELENKDPNAIYYKGDYETEAERLAAGRFLCYQVESEGAALLANNGALPLAQGAKVSTLSVNSVSLTYGGTGSGNVDASDAVNLKDALTDSGLVVNETIWDWYNSKEVTTLIDKAMASQTTEGESYALVGQAPITELSMSVYPEDVKNSISEYGDAVIITFSRVGGEGGGVGAHTCHGGAALKHHHVPGVRGGVKFAEHGPDVADGPAYLGGGQLYAEGVPGLQQNALGAHKPLTHRPVCGLAEVAALGVL